MLLPIHIAAGGLAIILGGIALTVRKGSFVHRRSGIFFVYAMIAMGVTGSVLGYLRGQAANVFAGFMTAYFVGTALTTVRPATPTTRRINIAGLIIASGLSILDFFFGIVAFNSPSRSLNGAPFFMIFILSAVLGLAAIGDVRQMRSGPLVGSARLRRHLWRMCFALFIAAGSFFSIRKRVAMVLPEFFAAPFMRALPILLIFGAMFYWLWRLRGKRALALK